VIVITISIDYKLLFAESSSDVITMMTSSIRKFLQNVPLEEREKMQRNRKRKNTNDIFNIQQVHWDLFSTG